nr:MAG: hypothetical protein [Skomarfal virus 2]
MSMPIYIHQTCDIIQTEGQFKVYLSEPRQSTPPHLRASTDRWLTYKEYARDWDKTELTFQPLTRSTKWWLRVLRWLRPPAVCRRTTTMALPQVSISPSSRLKSGLIFRLVYRLIDAIKGVLIRTGIRREDPPHKLTTNVLLQRRLTQHCNNRLHSHCQIQSPEFRHLDQTRCNLFRHQDQPTPLHLQHKLESQEQVRLLTQYPPQPPSRIRRMYRWCKRQLSRLRLRHLIWPAGVITLLLVRRAISSRLLRSAPSTTLGPSLVAGLCSSEDSEFFEDLVRLRAEIALARCEEHLLSLEQQRRSSWGASLHTMRTRSSQFLTSTCQRMQSREWRKRQLTLAKKHASSFSIMTRTALKRGHLLCTKGWQTRYESLALGKSALRRTGRKLSAALRESGITGALASLIN